MNRKKPYPLPNNIRPMPPSPPPPPKGGTDHVYESAIVSSCLDYLRLRGIFCWRQNSGAFMTPDGKRFMRTQDITGVADIIGVLQNGRFLAIECKTARGKQRESQKNFQEAIERNQGLYIIARSIDDLKIIEKNG